MNEKLSAALKNLHKVIEEERLNPSALGVKDDDDMLVFAVNYLSANCDHAFDPDAGYDPDPRNEIAEMEFELCGPNGLMTITESQAELLESIDMIYYDEARECYFCEGLTTLADVREELAG